MIGDHLCASLLLVLCVHVIPLQPIVYGTYNAPVVYPDRRIVIFYLSSSRN